MLKRSTCYGLCALMLAALMLQGCMGFGGSAEIIAMRVKGPVKGPKKLDGWKKYKWPAYNGPKKIVAIGIVEAKATHPGIAQLKAGIGAELRTLLFKSNRFRIVERRDKGMKDTLDEQDLANAGLTHAASSPKGGKMIGAGYRIDATLIRAQDNAAGGNMGGFGASANKKGASAGSWGFGGKRCEVEIQVQIRDTQTTEVIAAITGLGYDAKGGITYTAAAVVPGAVRGQTFGSYGKTAIGRAAKRATAEAVLSIVNTLGKKKWKGIVIDVTDDDNLSLVGGTDSNLKVGMRMKVLHRVKELINPQTGESLGWDTKEVATVVISRTLESASFAKVDSGTLEDVEPMDFLEMVEVKAVPAGGAGGGGL